MEVRGVSRSFGAIRALKSVDLKLRAGEVHALVGENGAGKSTLAKIIAGNLRNDSGSMRLFGQPYEPKNRVAGAAAGVAYVRQELSLVRGLTLAENLQLGRPGAPIRFDPTDADRELARLAKQYGLRVEPDRLVDDLPLADRQRAEILMSVAWGARILLLDEPSSALGPKEVEALLDLCRKLRDGGVAILYISHRLREIAAIGDTITVLRQGEVVGSEVDIRDFDAREIAALMIGDLPVSDTMRPRPRLGSTRLEARGLSLKVPHGPGLKDVSLSVRGGEIVGVVGVAGNGQDELASVLVGLTEPDSGTVLLDGQDVTGSPQRTLAGGIAYLPEEREEGLALDLTVADNAIARRARDRELSFAGFRRWAGIRRFTKRLLSLFEVRPEEPEMPARLLSGGNRQKLMAGRELEFGPSVLVAAGPTKGLDPLAARVMRDRLFHVAEEGGGVIVISADIDEVLDLAHRIVVISRGSVTDEFPAEQCTAARLGAAMAGITL